MKINPNATKNEPATESASMPSTTSYQRN
jgi:hypothetical protein